MVQLLGSIIKNPEFGVIDTILELHPEICNWKGWEHFKAKVMWSMLGYNFRVLTKMALAMTVVTG